MVYATSGTYTLPISSNGCTNGFCQTLDIVTVDVSTNPVKIIVTGTDLIYGSTGTWNLYAQGSSCELIASPTGSWWPHGHGCDYSSGLIGITDATSGGTAVAASSQTYIRQVTVPVPTAISAMRFSMGATITCNMDLGFYDTTGRLVVHTGSFVPTGTSVNTINVTSPAILLPGTYYLALDDSATTCTPMRVFNAQPNVGCATFATAAFPLPATITLANFAATVNCYAMDGVPVGGSQF